MAKKDRDQAVLELRGKIFTLENLVALLLARHEEGDVILTAVNDALEVVGKDLTVELADPKDAQATLKAASLSIEAIRKRIGK